MSETWLREALRRAVQAQPAAGDRAAGAFAVVARRRRQRLVAGSCTAALAVVAAGALAGGPAGTTGLEPTRPDHATSAAATVPPRPPAEGGAGGAVAGGAPVAGPRPAPGAAGAVVGPGTGAGGGVPAAAKPAIDVYFLVDATGDMIAAHPAIATAVDGIAARLAERATLRHGYGVFRDVTVADTIATAPVYERLSAVRADGGRLGDIRYAGGGDIPEGHVFGLDGALGEAHEPWTIDPPAAGFSAGARKVVVLVTSAEVKQDAHYPKLSDTLARLRAAGVVVASLLVDTYNPDGAARDDLETIARGTGAVAAAAADCGGTGRPLRAGDPLVCDLGAGGTFDGFADALLALR